MTDIRRNMLAYRPVMLIAPLAALALLAAGGCQPPEAPEVDAPRTAPDQPVRVVVVDDPPLGEAIEQQWQARAETPVEITHVTAAELQQAPALSADVIVYPSGMIGMLAERNWIVPLSSDVLNSPHLKRHDIFDVPRRQETSWGRDAMAVPLGSPQFVLLFRQDIFDHYELAVPSDWQQYLQTVQQLAQLGHPNQQQTEPEDSRVASGTGDVGREIPWSGTVEPLGPGWASQVLLARAAAYARHRSQYSTLFDIETMEPLITGPPFVRALEELAETATWLPPDAADVTPAGAKKRLLNGQAAMAITWPSPVFSQHAVETIPGDARVGFAELPGSHDVYNYPARRWERRGEAESPHVPLVAISGRLASPVFRARQPAAASNLLAWLAGPELSSTVSTVSSATTMFRHEHLLDASLWVDPVLEDVVSQYAELAETVQNRRQILFSPRIPGRVEYLSALDEAVHACLRGEQGAAEALEAAADRWSEITQELGVTSQRSAYRQSLGLDR